MKSVAFISAAGWKRSGTERDLDDCPEPFLPLGDGTTPLYRIARTLTWLGYEVYIGMAPVGYEFSQHWPQYTEEEPLEGSPWTQERENYASRLGTVVHIPDPGRSGSNDTFCSMLETVTDWDRVVMVRGDMLLGEGDLEKILDELPWPSQYQMACNHAIYLLDKAGAAAYLRQMEPWRHREWPTRKAWSNAMHRWVPDGHPEGSGQFADAGVPMYGAHNGPKVKWFDVDTPETYEEALALVQKEPFIWRGCPIEEWPEVVLLMTTWAGPAELHIEEKRLEYTRKTVAALKTHFIYPNYTWHIADDGSPEWYQEKVRAIMKGETYTFTDTKKGWDLNNNINTGLRAAFERADYVVIWPDDRFLEKDLEIEPCVRLLREFEDICYVRFTGQTPFLEGELVTRVGEQWRLLDKKSRARHVYLCFCFLMHKRWLDHYGYLQTDLWPVSAAEDEVNAHFRRTPGPSAVIPEAFWEGFIPWGGASTWEKPQGGMFRKTPPPLEERRR